MTAALRIGVDGANPGQFLASCGLLEIADRLWGGAEGWFDATHFHLFGDGTIDVLLRALVTRSAVELGTLDGLPVKPLIAPLRIELGEAAGQVLVLDGWATTKIEKGVVIAGANPPWNFWSGQQTSLRIWKALRTSLLGQLETPHHMEQLFSIRVPLSGRFGFDPGAAWNALDVGFSPNEQGMDVASSPAVELLAAVGLQRFRPRVDRDRASFHYATWHTPLSPVPAAAAAAGADVGALLTHYRGRVVARGSYAALGYSTMATKGHDDE